MVNKHIYSTRMYISLIINVSVSLMVSRVLPHMASPPLREGRKLDVLEKINYSAHETETCQGQFNITDIFTQIILFAQRNQLE